MKRYIFLLIILLVGCSGTDVQNGEPARVAEIVLEDYSVGYFAGGCFWCTESDFEKLEGVVEAVSGFSGGTTENPTYEDSNSGTTGHTETVAVYYDQTVVSYQELVEDFFMHHDPTDADGQFVDRGSQYRPAIFYSSDEEKMIISDMVIHFAEFFKKPIVTEVSKFTAFYPAEDYHQDYYIKSPVRYNYYRKGSGRDQFLESVWGNSFEDLKQRLTPLQYHVTQESGTEPPFDNEYWDNKEDGIYVDIVTGLPLYSSLDKFDSGTGWPSFTKALVPENIVTSLDWSLGIPRTEVRSADGSHLGHIFKDGPAPDYIRHCINSAALRFVPLSDLEKEGYGEFIESFAASS